MNTAEDGSPRKAKTSRVLPHPLGRMKVPLVLLVVLPALAPTLVAAEPTCAVEICLVNEDGEAGAFTRGTGLILLTGEDRPYLVVVDLYGCEIATCRPGEAWQRLEAGPNGDASEVALYLCWPGHRLCTFQNHWSLESGGFVGTGACTPVLILDSGCLFATLTGNGEASTAYARLPCAVVPTLRDCEASAGGAPEPGGFVTWTIGPVGFDLVDVWLRDTTTVGVPTSPGEPVPVTRATCVQYVCVPQSANVSPDGVDAHVSRELCPIVACAPHADASAGPAGARADALLACAAYSCAAASAQATPSGARVCADLYLAFVGPYRPCV